jgi:hypothetical protein
MSIREASSHPQSKSLLLNQAREGSEPVDRIAAGEHGEIERSLLNIDFASLRRRTFTPSPTAWEDQALYFLLVDRFSDGNENGGHRDNDGRPVTSGGTPLHTPGNPGRIPYDEWLNAGSGWQGGTLEGLRSKLGYLKRLGVTALWVSPVFRQVAFKASYHGYGIQNFLDVDPHFGTREQFRDFVRAAHDHGIYVILDVHSPLNFRFRPGDNLPELPQGGTASGAPKRRAVAQNSSASAIRPWMVANT